MTTGDWPGLIPITIGAAIAAVAAWLAVRQRRLEAAGGRAVARVVAFFIALAGVGLVFVAGGIVVVLASLFQ